jgi:hypothetical protein
MERDSLRGCVITRTSSSCRRASRRSWANRGEFRAEVAVQPHGAHVVPAIIVVVVVRLGLNHRSSTVRSDTSCSVLKSL